MRNSPPKAFFFSRVKKKHKTVEGPLEEKWLNVMEKYEWERKKKLGKIIEQEDEENYAYDLLYKRFLHRR